MKKTHKVTLTVTEAGDDDDWYEDIVRIRDKDRGELWTGGVHKFIAKDKLSAYFILRGSPNGTDGTIVMDKAARRKLNLSSCEKLEFTIQEACFWGELCWVWGATNPVYRIAGRLGVLSLVLGTLAVVLGILPLLPAVKNLICP